MVTIVCRSAYSIVKVAQDLARVLGADLKLGLYIPWTVTGTVIIVGNPDGGFNMLALAHRHNRQIWYVTTEGPVRNKPPYMERAFIVANSEYTKEKLEESGWRVDAVVHHGIRYRPPREVPRKDLEFLYVSGYLKRKYPPECRPVIERLGRRLTLVTSTNNPYVNLAKQTWHLVSVYDGVGKMVFPGRVCTEERLLNLYRRAMFYLNMSTTEGFGLTPLEAMAFGCVPIVLRVKPFTEFIPRDCAVWYEPNGRIEHEPYGVFLIEHRHYDSEELLRAVERARWSEERARRCMEHAEKYHVTKVYRRFREFL